MYIKDKYGFLVFFFSKFRKIIFNVNKKYLKKINFKKLWKYKYYHYMVHLHFQIYSAVWQQDIK